MKDSSTQLTNRETEIIYHLERGLLYKEIAGMNFISIETVKKHTNNIYKKLNVRNRTEAVNKFSGGLMKAPGI